MINPLGRFRTGDQALVREINLSLVMHRLREHAPVSRAALAEITGLNKTTVSSLINELIEHQYVRELGYDNSGVGRPAVMLGLNPEAGCIISCEIGVDFISAIRTNFAAEITWQHREATPPDAAQQDILDRAVEILRAAESSRSCPLLGVAIGVPGLVDYQTGTLLFAPNLGWKNVPLGALWREVFKVPVFIDNEANLAALGEFYFGAATGRDPVLYVSVGVGLGGGIIRQGAVDRGKTGFAGEFGHMTIDPDGPLCNCGNRGCWETLVSQNTVLRSIQAAVRGGAQSLLADMAGGNLSNLSIVLVAEAARKGDRLAFETLQQVGSYLGIGISSLVNALNPDLVVLGGIFSVAADILLPIIKAEVAARSLSWNADASEIVLAQHGEQACMLGGVAIVYQKILSEPASMAVQLD